MVRLHLRPIGTVSSPYKSLEEAPRQGAGRGEISRILLDEGSEGVLADLEGGRAVILYWLHKADRTVVFSRERGKGVFATRGQDRPNPIGLALVEVLGVEGREVRVRHLDAIDGTPVLDILDPSTLGAGHG
ncbi:MAG: tRNA (N6-threonylcarbamoyladenosine(37)-N6)-methyltransferase TrmO [Candidatus Hydrothermarchaeota archaeon]